MSAGIVRKPFQVRALSGADHLASVLNGFNAGCWDLLCGSTHHFQSEPTQLCLCLIYACLGTLSSTKTETINWKYWTFWFVVNIKVEQACCWQTTSWIIHDFYPKKSKCSNALGEESETSLGHAYRLPYSVIGLLEAWPLRCLPLTATCKIEERSINLDNSTLCYFTEFRQFHFNSGLGYITYVRLYHHAGNDIH